MKNNFNSKFIADLRSLSKDSNITAQFEDRLLQKLNKEIDGKNSFNFKLLFNIQYIAPLLIFIFGIFLFSSLLFVNRNNNQNSTDFEESLDAVKMAPEADNLDNSYAAPELMAQESFTNTNYSSNLSCLTYEGEVILIDNDLDFQKFFEKNGQNCEDISYLGLDFENFALLGKRITGKACEVNSYSTNLLSDRKNTILINVDEIGSCNKDYNQVAWFLVDKSVTSKDFEIEIVKTRIP